MDKRRFVRTPSVLGAGGQQWEFARWTGNIDAYRHRRDYGVLVEAPLQLPDTVCLCLYSQRRETEEPDYPRKVKMLTKIAFLKTLGNEGENAIFGFHRRNVFDQYNFSYWSVLRYTRLRNFKKKNQYDSDPLICLRVNNRIAQEYIL